MLSVSAIAAMVVASSPAVAQVQTSASVQVSPAPSAPVATIVTRPAENILRVGTPVTVRVMENLTTEGKKVRVGQRVQLEVAENIMLNGMTVIPTGTPAVAEVTDVRNKGMWGKSGHMALRVLYARLGDRQVRLSGTFDDKGVTGTAGVVAAIALVPVAGFFVTGTSARIPAGSQAKAFLDEDLVIAAPAAASSPNGR